MTDVHRATVASYDPDRLGRAMSAAFVDDSGGAFLWPDRAERLDALRWYYGVLVPRMGFALGRVYTAADGSGQSVWLAPGRGVGLVPSLRAGALEIPRRWGIATTLRAKRLADTIEVLRAESAPPGHWYLLLLGVEPEAQGTGLGGRLMDPMLREADVQGRAVYLETSTASNLPFYQRFGFEVTGERRVPDRHGYWGMARSPS